MATNEQLTEELQRLATEVTRLSEDSARLRQEALGGVQAIPALVEAMARLADRSESSQRARLVDTKGIGKPSVFDGTESKYREWAAKFESFVIGVYGERFRQVLEWSIDRHETIDRGAWQQAYGQASDDEIEDIDEMVAQLHTALQQQVQVHRPPVLPERGRTWDNVSQVLPLDPLPDQAECEGRRLNQAGVRGGH